MTRLHAPADVASPQRSGYGMCSSHRSADLRSLALPFCWWRVPRVRGAHLLRGGVRGVALEKEGVADVVAPRHGGWCLMLGTPAAVSAKMISVSNGLCQLRRRLKWYRWISVSRKLMTWILRKPICFVLFCVTLKV